MAITKLTANFTEADIDDEIILMRLDNGELLSLAESAAAVWRLIDGRRDRAALVAALEAEFDGDVREIDGDVGELLRELQDTGLIAGA
ncbi:MAG TPA: PqqD family protein [Sphingomicrobium sp.]|nr:PqqD family protein [Sphingomicrobium sp.]